MRYCPTPHCGVLIADRGPKYCPRHARQHDAARGSAEARGYDGQWAQYSKQWLIRYPICGQRLGGAQSPQHSVCTQRGERVRAQVTDHIVPIRDGGARLDPHNWQSLCYRCNSAKG